MSPSHSRINKNAQVFHTSTDDDLPWTSGKVPNGFWDVRQNRVKYLQWLGVRLGIRRLEDWYQVRNFQFRQNYGATLLHRVYGSSMFAAMKDFRPQQHWLPWLFVSTPRGFWRDASNRRDFMQWMEGQLDITDTEDWYRVTRTDFVRHGGAGLLANYYRGSLLSAFHEYMPNYDWKPWFLSKVPNGFWRMPDNRRQYFVWLAERYNLQYEVDWRRLTRNDINDASGGSLLTEQYAGSVSRLVEEALSSGVVTAAAHSSDNETTHHNQR